MKSGAAFLMVLACSASGLLADPRKPAPRDFDPRSWLREHSRQQRVLVSREVRVCFLGDSITAFWQEQGAGAWRLDLGEFKPANCGIAGDRVEQIHYRARLLNFGDHVPEIFVVLAGTNNLGKETPDGPRQVAEGVRLLVLTLRRRFPKSGVLVLSVLPSGLEPGSQLRKDIHTVNGILSQGRLAGNYQFLSVHDRFVDTTGRWRPGLTLDGTHLTSRGYDVLAGPLAEKLSEMLEKPPR